MNNFNVEEYAKLTEEMMKKNGSILAKVDREVRDYNRISKKEKREFNRESGRDIFRFLKWINPFSRFRL